MFRDVELTPERAVPWITGEDVKAALRIADMSQDTAVAAMAAAACAAIETYCNTVIAQRTVIERITLQDSMRTLSLRYINASEVTRVEFDEREQTIGDFRLHKRAGFLRHINGQNFGAEADWVVTYRAGFSAIPAELCHAAIETAKMLYRESNRDTSIISHDVADVGSVTYADPMTSALNGVHVPLAIVPLLEPHALRYSV